MERHPMFMNWQNEAVQMAILPNSIYKLNAFHIKIPMTKI
jgi:hypothetical protein